MFNSALRLSVFCACVTPLASVAFDEKKPMFAELKVGDPAPAFELPDESGAKWKSTDYVGKKWVVMYFYPGDFTPGCTTQAKTYRDARKELTKMGVEVVGISGDTVEIHALFKKSLEINFTLLSDEDGAVASKFGVPFGKGSMVKASATGLFTRPGTAARWTFVIGKDGKIAYKNTKVVPETDAKTIAEFIASREKK